MNLIQLLEQNEVKIVRRATEALNRAHLQHYEEIGQDDCRQLLQKLFELTMQSVAIRNTTVMTDYARQIAEERFNADFDLHEVQTAFNVLEESIWKEITSELPPNEFAEAIGLVSSVLGAGKDMLAVSYVSLATKTKAPSLNVSALFKGPQGQ